MATFRKIAVYVLIALVVLWAAHWVVKRVRPAYTKWRLAQAFRKIEPWPATTNYSTDAWKRLVKAARAFQKADQNIAGIVLAEHFERFSNQPHQLAVEQGKALLLLRVMFDIPEQPDEEPGKQSSALNSSSAAGRSSTWPLKWEGNRPRLVSGFPNVPVFRQSVADEYTALRYRYKYRDLSKLEF